MSVAPPTPFKPRKGKEKATPDFDSDDLNPAITYRILFAQNLGARDPLRVIALCDSDAFYAACEMVRLGITDKPLAVVQWQSLLAINYPSRKFGLTRVSTSSIPALLLTCGEIDDEGTGGEGTMSGSRGCPCTDI
jgi:hypothetical protein